MVRTTTPSLFWPFSPFSLFESLNRHPLHGAGPRRRSAELPMEVWDGEHGLLLRLALPGLDPETLDVSLEEDRLHIQASRVDRGLEGAREIHRELPTGDVDLQLGLPFRPDDKGGEGLSARYELGMLELTLPRPAEQRPRRIDVQSS